MPMRSRSCGQLATVRGLPKVGAESLGIAIPEGIVQPAALGSSEPLTESVVPASSEDAIAENPRRAARNADAWIEFFLIGGGTLVLLPLAWWCRASLGLSESELLVGFLAFHAASLINDPHFAVTYLLFYKDAWRRAWGTQLAPEQRRRYQVAGFWVPLGLCACAGAALVMKSAPILGWMIQLMFLLVGWHYVKQGFGVLMVLSARRGVRWSRMERNVVLAHCWAGFAYAWASPADPGSKSVVNGVFYTTWPHPPGLEGITLGAFASSGVALVVMLVRKWARESRVPPLSGLVGLLITIWLWTVFTRLDPLLAFVIPALHSLQYLYFVALLRRNQAREAAGPPTFKGNAQRELFILAAAAVALGWLILRGLPGWLDGVLVSFAAARSRELAELGPTPYLAAFVSVVNIHHYFMDRVIWRREHPETRHLFA
jgi:hypothetical protein